MNQFGRSCLFLETKTIKTQRGVDLRGLVDTMPEAKFKDKKDKGPWKWSKDEVGYKQDDLLLMEWATKKSN